MTIRVFRSASALAVGFCVCIAATSVSRAVAQPSNAARAGPNTDLFARFRALADRNDVKSAHGEALALIQAPGFADLPAADRSQAWTIAAWLALRANDTAQALKDVENAISPSASPFTWRLRFLAASATAADQPVAIDSLQNLIDRYPRELASLPDELVVRTAAAQPASPETAAAQEAMSEALLALWRPQDPFFTTDGLLIVGVRSRLAAGRLPAARALASEIASRDATILLRADRRYDGLTTNDSWSLPTPREAAEARLSAIRILRARYPRRLNGALKEAQLLEILNADAEALQVVDKALAELKADPKAFDDVENTGGWLDEKRAALLTTLGRSDAATDAMRDAAAKKERGGDNVSNLLNLSVRLSYEDPKEAIRLTDLAAGRQISDYGRSVGLSARTCAYAHLNDRAKAQAAFAQLQALDAKGSAGGTLMQAAWCLGNEDAAARSLIAQLADSGRRASAILGLQDIPSKGELSADDADSAKMMLALSARADVQAALSPYGRIVQLKREELFRP